MRDAVDRLRPFVEPPEDLHITSSRGVIYSGIVIIEHNDVIAGVVIEVGRSTPTTSPTPAAARAPIITPPRFEPRSSFQDRPLIERSGRLPGWAEDSREVYSENDDDEEEPLWRR